MSEDGTPWSEFRAIHNIPSIVTSPYLVQILGLPAVGTGNHRRYGLREDRRWHTWRILRPDHERENGTAIARRILDLAGAHPTGWIVATCGRTWWQTTQPNPFDHLAKGVFVLQLDNLGCMVNPEPPKTDNL